MWANDQEPDSWEESYKEIKILGGDKKAYPLSHCDVLVCFTGDSLGFPSRPHVN